MYDKGAIRLDDAMEEEKKKGGKKCKRGGSGLVLTKHRLCLQLAVGSWQLAAGRMTR